MTIAIPNYSYRYNRRGKPVFAPSKIGRRIGAEIKAAVEDAYQFSPVFFHMRSGGHVAAMHVHRSHRHFARIDISHFFYSISRRRVQSALDRVGVGNAAFYAKWSTVSNPYKAPPYALPYGFVQSPILASLVVATSAIGDHLKQLSGAVCASVYLDDFSLSSDSLTDLQQAFDATVAAIEADGFSVSAEKLRSPAPMIDVFNCDLSFGRSVVRDDRIAAFEETLPGAAATDAFVRYCASVEEGNI